MGYFVGVPQNKDYGMLGSEWGPHYLGKTISIPTFSGGR